MLIDADRSLLAVVDMQVKLLDQFGQRRAGLVERVGVMIRAAGLLKVPVLVSEQYPEKLGDTVGLLSESLPAGSQVVSKLCFAASGHDRWHQVLAQAGREQVILVGVEAHVCILQTALDLKRRRWQSFVVEDAVDSYDRTDYDCSLARMRQGGVSIVSSEMVLFEWLRTAEHRCFRDISRLVKQLRQS